MKFSLKAVALAALVASVAIAAPIEVDKRDANSDRIIACFVGLIFTGSWPGSCQAAVAVNVGLIRSITINQMSMDFTPANPWAPTTSSNSIVAQMLSIPGVTLPIDSVRQHIILVDNGVQLGNIDTAWSAASVSGGTLTTSFSSSTLNVFPTAHAAFSNFVSALSTSASHPVTLQGAVDVKLNLGIFGQLTIPDIGFQATTPLVGLNNLSQTKYIYLIDNILTPGFIYLTSIINIVNPSALTLTLGDVNFSTASKNGYVGISTVKGLTLVPGNNYLLSDTVLNQAYPASTQFLNDIYTADGILYLTGYNATSTDVALNAGLASVKTTLTIPMAFNGLVLSQPPYLGWSLKVLPTTVNDSLVEITATFQSPYYGFAVTMIADNDGTNSNNAVVASSVSPASAGTSFFTFHNTSSFTVSGTNTIQTTFKVALPALTAGYKSVFSDLVTYGNANGHIPVDFNWFPVITVGNDPIHHNVDWGNLDNGLPDVNIAVGPDFAALLNAFPSS